MQNMRTRDHFAIRVAILLILVSFATEREARAYTDPGTGALIWQALVAGFVGLMYYFRRFATKLKRRKETKD
jgi:O-antigen/teichoic acid export membrane protein